MGQRTLIICKRNFADGTTSTSFQYHQWGIGKVMTAQFMQEYLACIYPVKPRGNKNERPSLKDFFLFNDEESLRHVVTTDIDVWNKAEILPHINMYDLNNGCMVVEVTERKDNYSSVGLENEKIGFLLGSEETHYVSEKAYTRFVSAKEYQILTGGLYCTKEWIECFEKFLKFFNIEQVVDEIEEPILTQLGYQMYHWEHRLYNVEVELDKTMLDEKALSRYNRLDYKKVTCAYSTDKHGMISIKELDLKVPLFAIKVDKLQKDSCFS